MIPVPSTSEGSQLLAWLTVILEENHTTWSRTTERVIAAPVETQSGTTERVFAIPVETQSGTTERVFAIPVETKSGTTERVFVIPVETQNFFCLNYNDFVNLVKHFANHLS